MGIHTWGKGFLGGTDNPGRGGLPGEEDPMAEGDQAASVSTGSGSLGQTSGSPESHRDGQVVEESVCGC